MSLAEIIISLLVIANLIVSYFGLKDERFFERYKFEVDAILIK
ncbi:MAG: rhomboid family intramembrane serine protease, partial [Bacteroidia bacterium]|nr:rhomboid family intramembrane serine protease [Bacteroidia bacterium]